MSREEMIFQGLMLGLYLIVPFAILTVALAIAESKFIKRIVRSLKNRRNV